MEGELVHKELEDFLQTGTVRYTCQQKY